MIRNILIEGIDCAGKSTLTKELKNHLLWDSKALGHKPGWQFERYLEEYTVSRQTIFERGHISNAIYSQLFNRPTPYTKRELELLNGLVDTTMLVILALPNTETARQRYIEREGVLQVIKEEELEVGNQLFAQFAARFPYAITYRSENFGELERLIDHVKQLILP